MPATVTGPVLFTVIEPPAVAVMSATVIGEAFVNKMFPVPVFAAVNVPTALAPLSVWPVTEIAFQYSARIDCARPGFGYRAGGIEDDRAAGRRRPAVRRSHVAAARRCVDGTRRY